MTTLHGWQCHDAFGHDSLPPDLWARLLERHGKPRMTAEVFGPQTAATLLAQRQEVLEGNRQFADICRDLLTHDRFDLFLAVFGLVHRGAHYLWDLSQIGRNDGDGPTRAVLEGGLDDCYASGDEALGRVLDAAPADARVVVFALHGMGPNDGWYGSCLAFSSGSTVARTAARGARPAVPLQAGPAVDAGAPGDPPIPPPGTRPWSRMVRRMHDWPSTRYFALPMDYNGYVRLNLKGREQQGSVDPADADRVLAEVDAALRTFRDIATGKPVIQGHDQRWTS
jgi:predicted AlkP superfamily phosphohydrolase/phosphomutase